MPGISVRAFGHISGSGTRLVSLLRAGAAWLTGAWALLLARLFFAILVAGALSFPLPQSAADDDSETWYLSDFSSTEPGADFVMYRGSGDGALDALTMPAGTSRVWAADEASNIVIDMSGEWEIDLRVKSLLPPSSRLTLEIGHLAGGVFVPRGVSNNRVVHQEWDELQFEIDTEEHIVNPGERLALRLNNTSPTKDFDIDLNDDSGDSPSHIGSPQEMPEYPGTLIISFTVIDNGGSAGVNFGSLWPGTQDGPEAEQGLGATGADYVMYEGGGDGEADDLAVLAGASRVWVANGAAESTVDMSGLWSVRLWAKSQSSSHSSRLRMRIGLISDGSFIVKGTSVNRSVSRQGGFISFRLTTRDHVISPGEHLAVMLENTSSYGFVIDLNDPSGDSPSYVTAPSGGDRWYLTDLGSRPAITLIVGAETSVNTYIQTRGTHFYISLANGAADGGSATTLVDAGAAFLSNGLAAGNVVINGTDGSSAVVLTVDGETQLTFAGPLSGGTDNVFSPGDLYVVRDASPSQTITVGNATWNASADAVTGTAVSEDYGTVASGAAGSGKTVGLWYWLDVPEGQYAGTYASMFYFQATQQ